MIATKSSKRQPGKKASNQAERASKTFLAAAIGDALGWPNEERARARGKSDSSIGFKRWERNAGGRYYPHVEPIGIGAYSDDTQLLLSTARSLINADADWFQYLTEIEIPLWRSYERGGGGALLRAAQHWANGTAPWSASDPADVDRYFSAGGNGGVMRILPHCLRRQSDSTFGEIAKDVTRNTLATHAHPRAVVGSLAYAYALWSALRQKPPLKFGRLVTQVREGLSKFSEPPYDVFAQLEIRLPERYQSTWAQAIEEMDQYLNVAADALAQGAVFVEQETLQKLGATSPQTNGAGHVAAASAIFLASRYASDPEQGVIEAAYAHGADTDTMASMTAALVASFSSTDWVEHYKKQLQDYEYISDLAIRLIKDKPAVHHWKPLKSSELNGFRDSLENAQPGDSVSLPDGRAAIFSERIELRSRANIDVRQFVLKSSDGQSLFFKRVTRPSASAIASKPNDAQQGSLFAPEEVIASPFVHSPQTIVLCRDVSRSLRFYVDTLGMRIWQDNRPKSNAVLLDGTIMLFQTQNAERSGSTRLRFRTRFLTNVRELLERNGFSVSSRTGVDEIKSIDAKDPDGNIVEIIEDFSR